MWRKVKSILFVVLICTSIASAMMLIPSADVFDDLTGGLAYSRVEERALALMGSSTLKFLVTSRIETLVLVKVDENSLLLGRRRGHLLANVCLYYGFDLSSMTVNSIEKQGDMLIITLPQPRELDLSVDLTSITYVTVRSGTAIIADWLAGKDFHAELRTEFHKQALTYLCSQGLIPSRTDIVEKLRFEEAWMEEVLGIAVQFR